MFVNKTFSVMVQVVYTPVSVLLIGLSALPLVAWSLISLTYIQQPRHLDSANTHTHVSELKQPISSTHLKVSPRLLTRVEDKRGGREPVDSRVLF